MPKHDYFYRKGLEAGATKSLLRQVEWLMGQKYLNINQIMRLHKYVLQRLMPQENQEQALKILSFDQVYQSGEEKGEEIATLEALRFLGEEKILAQIPKNDQVKFLQVGNTKMNAESAISLIYGKVI